MTLADLIIIVRRRIVLCILVAVVGMALAGIGSAAMQVLNPGPAYSATSWVTGTTSLGTVKDIAQVEAASYDQLTWSFSYSDSKASVLIVAQGNDEDEVLAAANAVARATEQRAIDEYQINAVAKDAPKAVAQATGLSLGKTAKYALAGLLGGFCVAALVAIASVLLGGYVVSAKQVSRALNVPHLGGFDVRDKKSPASVFTNMKSAKGPTRVACVIQTAPKGGLDPLAVNTESRSILVCRLKTGKGAPQLKSKSGELIVPVNITPELAQRVVTKLESTKWEDVYVLISKPSDNSAAQVLLGAVGVALVDVKPFVSTVDSVLDAQKSVELANARLVGIVC